MACACKTQKQLLTNKKQIVDGYDNKKGIKYFLNLIFIDILLKRVIMALFMLTICIILMPLITVLLIITQLYGGKARIPVPQRFAKYIN